MRDTIEYQFKANGFDRLQELAEQYGYYIWRTLHSHNQFLVSFGYEPSDTYFENFASGWFDSALDAIQHSIWLLETYKMNLHENKQLFPHITGDMLKDQAVRLTMNGVVKIHEPIAKRDGESDAPQRGRVEVGFIERPKTIMINANQTQNIIHMYGSETDNWKGKEIIIFGEHGRWFGKWQYGVRVWDTTTKNNPPEVVANLLNKERRNKKAKNGSKPHKVVPFKKNVEEPGQGELFENKPEIAGYEGG